MPLKSNIVYKLISLSLGITYIISAYSKMIDFESTEIIILNTGLISWELSELSSRLLVIIEYTLGLWLLFTIIYKNKIPYLVSVVSLILFSFYLIFLISIGNNQADCGCFGDLITMNPKAALTKNLFLLLASAYGLYFKNEKHTAHTFFFISSIIIVSTTTMLQYPIENIFERDETTITKTAFKNTPLAQLDSSAAAQLTRENQFLLFVSPTCKHCKTLVKKLNKVKTTDTDSGAMVVISGTPKAIEKFTQTTENKLHTLVIDKEIHLKISKGVVPKVFYSKSDTIYGYWTPSSFFPEKITKSLD